MIRKFNRNEFYNIMPQTSKDFEKYWRGARGCSTISKRIAWNAWQASRRYTRKETET
jgi:hypothetical protein